MDRIGGDVERELARFGPSPGLAPLVERWPTAVGADVARNAWPARLARDGTLHVHTSSAAWAYELAHLETRIRDALGDVAPPRLRFAVGPLPDATGQPSEQHRAPPPAPAEADLRAADRLAAPIADEKLRKVVAEAAALSLARAESDRRFW